MLEHQQDIKRSFVPSSQTVLNIHYLQKSSGWFDFSSDAVEVALKEPSWFEALLGSQSPWTAHQDCWIFKVVGSKRWSLISRFATNTRRSKEMNNSSPYATTSPPVLHSTTT
ncbi:hypothetical protein C5167_018531 [Papaver somniferum]|uniref:Uncharacterized protein n=1 Tax=Papaver somniferum TaxID=3469 RepID=A0A4Y7IRI9_PAPSO|nr:hypothetical protein C5167_018531 [Papaver somniferum]